MNFDKKWRDITQIFEAPRQAVRWMIQKHYLKKWPGVIRCILVMVCKGETKGCIIFAEPPRETNKRFGGKGFELARLWISDVVPRNAETWFIGRAIRFIKRKWPTLTYLVSYADPSAGHNGTIYKAANWIYDGMTDAGRKTPRCDYLDENGKKYSRKSHIPKDIIYRRIPRKSKHRYVYWLKKKNANT